MQTLNYKNTEIEFNEGRPFPYTVDGFAYATLGAAKACITKNQARNTEYELNDKAFEIESQAIENGLDVNFDLILQVLRSKGGNAVQAKMVLGFYA